MTYYVLRYAYESNKWPEMVPVSGDRPTHYLYKSVSVSRRSGSWGHLRWQITPDIEQARTWRTREGAESYLADKLTYASGSLFVVEEIVEDEPPVRPSVIVAAPTITKLREALDQLVADGVEEDTPLTISHLANAPGNFVISELPQ